MPALTILVDGYNVLMRDRALVQLSLLAARTALLARAGRFKTGQPVSRIVVVFDGRQGMEAGPVGRGATARVSAVFAAPDADTCICAWIRRARSAQSLLVVSDDRAIRDTARAHGAARMTVAVFLDATQPAAIHQPAAASAGVSAQEARRITDELRRHWRL